MEETVKKFARRYPWREWLDYLPITLCRGVDYDCEPSSMALMLRGAAERYGVCISIRVRGDVLEVTRRIKR